MSIASALWRKNLEDSGYPTSGAFVPTCLPFVEKELADGYNKMYDNVC